MKPELNVWWNLTNLAFFKKIFCARAFVNPTVVGICEQFVLLNPLDFARQILTMNMLLSGLELLGIVYQKNWELDHGYQHTPLFDRDCCVSRRYCGSDEISFVITLKVLFLCNTKLWEVSFDQGSVLFLVYSNKINYTRIFNLTIWIDIGQVLLGRDIVTEMAISA